MGIESMPRKKIIRRWLACLLFLLPTYSGCNSGADKSGAHIAANETSNETMEKDETEDQVQDLTDEQKEPKPDVVEMSVREALDNHDVVRPVIRVTAKVHHVEPNKVVIAGDSENELLTCVIDDPRAFDHMSKGNTIIMQGKPGFRSLTEATVVSCEGTPVPRVTVEELFTGLFDEREKTVKARDWKQMVVSGVVLKSNIDTWEKDRVHTMLHSDEYPRWQLPLKGEKKEFESVKAGDTITVLGTCIFSQSAVEPVLINFAILIVPTDPDSQTPPEKD